MTWPDGYTYNIDYTPGPWDFVPEIGETWAAQDKWKGYLRYEHPAADLHVQLPPSAGSVNGFIDTIRVGSWEGGYCNGPGDYNLDNVTDLPPTFWAELSVCHTMNVHNDPYLYAHAVGQWAKTAFTGLDLPGYGTAKLEFLGIHTGGGEFLPDPYPEMTVTTMQTMTDPANTPQPDVTEG